MIVCALSVSKVSFPMCTYYFSKREIQFSCATKEFPSKVPSPVCLGLPFIIKGFKVYVKCFSLFSVFILISSIQIPIHLNVASCLIKLSAKSISNFCTLENATERTY